MLYCIVLLLPARVLFAIKIIIFKCNYKNRMHFFVSILTCKSVDRSTLRFIQSVLRSTRLPLQTKWDSVLAFTRQ